MQLRGIGTITLENGQSVRASYTITPLGERKPSIIAFTPVIRLSAEELKGHPTLETEDHHYFRLTITSPWYAEPLEARGTESIPDTQEAQ